MLPFPKKLRHGSGKLMVRDESRILMTFKKPRKRRALKAALGRVGIACESLSTEKRTGRDHFFDTVNHSDRAFWIRQIEGKKISDANQRALRRHFRQEIEYFAPVYRIAGTRDEGGLVSPSPVTLLVKPKTTLTSTKLSALERRLATLGLEEVKERSRYLVGFRYYRVKNPAKQSAYELRDAVAKRLRTYVEDVRLENIPFLKPITVVPNDTLYSSQWNMPQIDAETTWNWTAGHGSVVVAVLDSGCDLTHPDLDYGANGVNLGTMSGDGSPVGTAKTRGHGTCCAGIIAAPIDNNQGVAGLAGRCLILPIAFSTWSDAECAAGIRYAADHGAKVISMSFGNYGPGEGLSPASWDFAVIDPAIEYAHEKGLVLCAATGTEDINTFNRYPSCQRGHSAFICTSSRHLTHGGDIR